MNLLAVPKGRRAFLGFAECIRDDNQIVFNMDSFHNCDYDMVFLHKIIDALEAQNIKVFIRTSGPKVRSVDTRETHSIWFRVNPIDYPFRKGTMYMVYVSFTNIPGRDLDSLEIFLHIPKKDPIPTLFRVEFKKGNREGDDCKWNYI